MDGAQVMHTVSALSYSHQLWRKSSPPGPSVGDIARPPPFSTATQTQARAGWLVGEPYTPPLPLRCIVTPFGGSPIVGKLNSW